MIDRCRIPILQIMIIVMIKRRVSPSRDDAESARCGTRYLIRISVGLWSAQRMESWKKGLKDIGRLRDMLKTLNGKALQ